MNALRILCGLLVLTAGWAFLLPAEPTLFAPAPPPSAERVATGIALPDETAALREVAPSVRQIVPSPVPTGGDLRRLPNAASGAAVPARQEMEGDGAPAEAPATVLPVPDTSEALAALPEADGADAPEFRLFARPIAVDSGTLRVGDVTVRVAGVVPVAPEARCGEAERSWPCGARARTAFRSWLRGRSVLCSVPARSQESLDLDVPCLLGETDVGAWLVRNGWATASAGSRYAADEDTARENGVGVWSAERR